MRKIYLFTFTILLVSCKSINFKERWTQLKAPKKFKAKFETTKGDFVIESQRNWSPLAVDRLYQLVKTGFYTDVAFYRTVPNFVAQFGIQNDSLLHTKWSNFTLKDELVIEKNDSLTISFARSGKNSRSTHLFINLKNNHKLDTIKFNKVVGFPVVAKVVKGGNVVQNLYSGYSNSIFKDYDSILRKGNKFLRRKYPKLDYIKKAYLIK